jgi:hypothetical protein
LIASRQAALARTRLGFASILIRAMMGGETGRDWGWQMARIAFTQNIQRHVTCRETEAAGASVREVLDNLFAGNPRARAYVLDDQAELRKHMTIFVDGQMIRDRQRLSDPVGETSDIYVFQALSGG